MSTRSTIKIIAEKAGVSQLTVTNALRGYGDISKETTEQIRKIAEEVGYRPRLDANNISSNDSTATE